MDSRHDKRVDLSHLLQRQSGKADHLGKGPVELRCALREKLSSSPLRRDRLGHTGCVPYEYGVKVLH